MSLKQRTIEKEVNLQGAGLHTGTQVKITLKPAKENSGIKFIRTDLPNAPVIKAEPGNIRTDTGMSRCNSIGSAGVVIHTVEHLMSVLSGLEISNLDIELDGNELPGLDGSGLEYLDAIKNAGIKEQEADLKYFEIMEPIGVSENGSSIFISPAKDLKISYTLDYNHPFLRSMFFSSVINRETYAKDIAPCRTFCLETEAEDLKSEGLGKGANYKNTLVVGDNGVKDNKTRFDNEFARHKVLDFIGDLYLLGMPIRGHVFAVKSGHDLNIRLLKKIQQQKERMEKLGLGLNINLEFSGKREILADEIMKILPHRYPFLLVDRVIEIEKGKKAIGIKNVTANEDFFEGHFPTRPVMPGVLMVEAMAQTAGVTVLRNEEHRGKIAFFSTANNVKFRKVVEPGDQVLMEVEVVKDRPRLAQIRAVARVGSDIVAEADMVFSFTDASYLA